MTYALKVGDKVKFREERQPYTVQACDARFAVCTKPFNPRRTVLYSIIDFKENVRGTENLLFGMGAETREQCEEMLDRLNGRDPFRAKHRALAVEAGVDPALVEAIRTEVSHRNRIALDIEHAYTPRPKAIA